MSEDVQNLIKKLLSNDVSKRISPKEALKDPWFDDLPKKDVDPSVMQAAL